MFPHHSKFQDSSAGEIQLQRFYGEQRKVGFSAPGYFTLAPPVSFIKNIQNEPI